MVLSRSFKKRPYLIFLGLGFIQHALCFFHLVLTCGCLFEQGIQCSLCFFITCKHLFSLLTIIDVGLERILDSVLISIELNSQIMDGLRQSIAFITKQCVDLLLNFADSIVEFNQGFASCLDLLLKVCCFFNKSKLFCNLVFQFHPKTRIHCLIALCTGCCQLIRNRLRLHGNLSLLFEFLEANLLLLLQHTDTFNV